MPQALHHSRNSSKKRRRLSASNDRSDVRGKVARELSPEPQQLPSIGTEGRSVANVHGSSQPILHPPTSEGLPTELGYNSTSRPPVPERHNLQGRSFFSNAHQFTIQQAHMVDASVNVLRGSQGLDILRSHIATSALHDSKERFDPPKCDEDTRVGLIEEIMDWMEDKNTLSKLICMTGPAGSGKSALAQTLAEMCAEKGTLAASFFFSSTDPRRNNTSQFISTIAYQVAQSNDDARPIILQAVEKDPSIFDRSLETQVQTLLAKPLLQVAQQHANGAELGMAPYAIFIDGLDECNGENHQSHLLRVIHSCLLDNHLPLKVFLSSRPEYAIRTALSQNGHLSKSNLVYRIELSEYDATADIRLYLRRTLRAIGAASPDLRASAESWPGNEDIERLVDNASGQFIYAATVVKFVGERRRSPFARLQAVLGWTSGVQHRENPFAALDALYANILRSAQAAYEGEAADPLAIVRLLHKIMYYRRPYPASRKYLMSSRNDIPVLTKGQFEIFFGFQPGDISLMLSDLFSLVKALHSVGNPSEMLQITFHHKSFAEFLADPRRSGGLFLPERDIRLDMLGISMKWIDLFAEGDVRDVFRVEQLQDCNQILRFTLFQFPNYLWHSMRRSEGDYEVEGRSLMNRAFAAFSQTGAWGVLARAHFIWGGTPNNVFEQRLGMYGNEGSETNSTWRARKDAMTSFLSMWEGCYRRFLQDFKGVKMKMKTRSASTSAGKPVLKPKSRAGAAGSRKR